MPVWAALDRAEACAQHIKRDRKISHTKAGPEDGPALKHERAYRAFVVRTLAWQGLDVEAVRPVKRPYVVAMVQAAAPGLAQDRTAALAA